MSTDPYESAADRVSRESTALMIRNHPERFLFCEACENIFKRGGVVEITGLCVICHGYRLNKAPEEVAELAARLATRKSNSVTPADYV